MQAPKTVGQVKRHKKPFGFQSPRAVFGGTFDGFGLGSKARAKRSRDRQIVNLMC